MKYIHVDSGKKCGPIYNIRKQINNVQYNLCYSRDVEELLPIRDYLISCAWNLDEIERIKKEWDKKLKRPKQYISKVVHHSKTVYIIRKWNPDGRCIRYGQADTLEKAIQLRDTCINENWKRRHYKSKKCKPNKHIQYRNGLWYLERTIDHKRHVFGSKYTYMEIIDLRKRVEEADWDTSIQEFVTKPHNTINRYIVYHHGKYGIQKLLDDGYFRTGGFSTIEEAREERDFWESINWDFDLLDLY